MAAAKKQAKSTKSAKATKTVAPPAPAAPAARRFTRSSSDKWVAGVAGGLARYFNIDPLLTRILTIVLCFTGVGLLAYILMWIFVPQE